MDSQSTVAKRRTAAKARASAARASLAECHLCEHHCGVNRLCNERGRCHTGAESRIFSAQVEVTDELEVAPSYSIAFSGCDLRCAFCITGAESWNSSAGSRIEPAEVAERGIRSLQQGARSIMFLGGEPTIHLPAVLDIVSFLPDDARLVWKTNAHQSAQARELLEGLFDVWIADFKFGNDNCADRLAKVARYRNVIQENLLWAARQSELIIRHVLMPGHVECCWCPVASWIAEHLPEAKVSLRTGFWPAWNSWKHPELMRIADAGQITRARSIAQELNLNMIS